ncbi:MAG: hypothetical protein K5681_05115 [Treponema sp.]|nr:hypothetical protein [Treponema sp.]
MINDSGKEQKNSKDEALYKTVIVSEYFNPVRIIASFFVVLMILAVMFVYTYSQRKNIISNAEQVTNQMAEYIAGNIANETNFAETSINFAASTISHTMTSKVLENPSEIITPMLENTPFGGIEYVRADGMNVMNIGEAFDASDRIYYIEGMKGHTGVWNNYHPKTSKETLMNFYTPIVYQEEVVGVLTGYIAARSQVVPLFEKKLYGQEMSLLPFFPVIMKN